MFQNPCCVRGRGGLWFVRVKILPLCGAVLQGARCGFLSIEQPIFNPRVSSQDWSYLRRKTRGKGKQRVRNDSFPGKRHCPCFFCLSFLKCCFFGLDKLLDFWTGLFEPTHSHHPKGPIALLAYRCDRKQSIAGQRSSLKRLSPELLFGFSYIGGIDNISSILPSLEVGLISPLGSKPQISSHFVGLCEMLSLTTWVISLLNSGQTVSHVVSINYEGPRRVIKLLQSLRKFWEEKKKNT